MSHNALTAVPRFLWWGFKRASWLERAIVVTALLLLLGLLWPADDSDAALGDRKWSTPDVEFHRTGTWTGANQSWLNAVDDGAERWEDATDWNPVVVSTAQENDILWSTLLQGWTKCTEPTGTIWAKTCIRFNKSTKIISETDISFNPRKSWSTGRVLGIATHEFGHAGGLEHDPNNSSCEPDFTGRFTMCEYFTTTNASWAGHLETHDIEDANEKY